MSDLLLGFYLSVILLADFTFKETCIIREEEWRSGTIHFGTFCIILYYTILSQLLFLLLSTSRLMVVSYPVATKFKSHTYTLKCVGYICIISLIISCSVTLFGMCGVGFLPFKLCLFFVDPSNSIEFLKILTYFTALTTTTTISLQYLLLLLIKELKQSKVTVIKSVSKETSKTSVIVKLVLTTASCFLSCFPSSIIFIAIMFLSKYPIHLITWTITL